MNLIIRKFFYLLCVINFFSSVTVLAVTPTINIYGTEIFTRSTTKPVTEKRSFEVPKTGSAKLIMKNGTPNMLLNSDLISSAIITLNGKNLLLPSNYNQNVKLVELPVTVINGKNTLTVQLRSKVNGKISIQISAPVDAINLKSIPDPLRVGVDSLSCEASVTALGVPANGIAVSFEVTGFGIIPSVQSQTNLSGIAQATFDKFMTSGIGAVSATVVGSEPLLNDSEVFEVKNFLQLTLDQGLNSMELEAGQTQYVAYAINLSNTNGNTYHVTFNQTILPDNGGIETFNDYMGGWETTTDQTWVVNEAVIGGTPGQFKIMTTVGIVETGDIVSSELVVNVSNSTEGIPKLWKLGADPSGMSPNTPTEITFSVLVTGITIPSTVRLEQVDQNNNPISSLGELNDNGENGDLLPNDGVYSGTFIITAESKGKLYYQAVADYNEHEYPSDSTALTITDLPIVPAPSDNTTDLIVDETTGESIYPNKLLIAFYETVTEERILEIVTAGGGMVIGSIPELDAYEISLPSAGSIVLLQNAIQFFQSFAEVKYAEKSGYVEIDAFTPDDSRFNSQKNMIIIRADEAWVLAKGWKLIGVVDSGVDYNHEDLKSKTVKGKDFVSNDDDPMDTNSHGTHVAGIAAASSNNSKGVAGVSWDSKILAIRGLQGSAAALAKAMLYASEKGCTIINVSGGTETDYQVIREATKTIASSGKLLCAAAGNRNSFGLHGNTKQYPGDYDEAFCVGNTTNDDKKAFMSRYGTWVDIAAPGEGILSTVLNNGYDTKSGTSMASPLVAGAAAVVWSMHPSWTAAKVRERLEKTAKPLDASLQIGVGRIDLFNAVFNGNFEMGDLSEWSATGTCSVLESLGPLKPTEGKRMAYCSTGPAGDQVAATLQKNFTIQPGVTSFLIKFDYNFVTEEYPEWVGTIYNDTLTIKLTPPGGEVAYIWVESVNKSSFSSVSGIDFPGGDNTVGQTGWRTGEATIPVTDGAGNYKINITDAGDDIYDSVILIDNIRLK